MKAFIVLLALMTSGIAAADSAKFQVNPFKGELSIEPADVKIQSLNMHARIQHCNFWGTTCAGGPSTEQSAVLSFKQNSATNLLVIKNDVKIGLKSTKVGNRFSSCSLNVAISGVGPDGSKYEGHLGLVHINDKEVCASAAQISEVIAEALKVPRPIKMWKKIRQ